MPVDAEKLPELDWIELRKEFESGYELETVKEKILRKNKDNPFVLIGCTATLAALCYGLWNFRLGRAKMSQYMMRTRIVAQGFTIMALVIGMGYTASKTTK